jgi:hypothetical protein
VTPGYYLFIARTACSEANFEQLRSDMTALVDGAAGMTASMPDRR